MSYYPVNSSASTNRGKYNLTATGTQRKKLILKAALRSSCCSHTGGCSKNASLLRHHLTDCQQAAADLAQASVAKPGSYAHWHGNDMVVSYEPTEDDLAEIREINKCSRRLWEQWTTRLERKLAAQPADFAPRLAILKSTGKRPCKGVRSEPQEPGALEQRQARAREARTPPQDFASAAIDKRVGAAWLKRARTGYCSVTTDDVGDCEGGETGAWPTWPLWEDNAARGATNSSGEAAASCLRRCSTCKRCRFISLSMQHESCEWHHECPVVRSGGGDEPVTAAIASTFKSGPVVSPQAPFRRRRRGPAASPDRPQARPQARLPAPELARERPNYRSALASMFSRASMLHAQGNLSGAEPLYREVLVGRRAILGDDHRITLRTIELLTALLVQRGKSADFEEASRVLGAAVETSTAVHGPFHPSALSLEGNAAWLRLARDGDAAPLFAALEHMEGWFGMEHALPQKYAYILEQAAEAVEEKAVAAIAAAMTDAKSVGQEVDPVAASLARARGKRRGQIETWIAKASRA